jgi:prevent-host-death family protein
MITVGIRELRQQASELIRAVREEGRKIEITYRGKPVALLVPVEPTVPTIEVPDDWVRLDHIAAEIGARWPQGVSAAEAVAEGRG